MKDFKTCYQEYKANLPSYFSEDKTYKTWDFRVRKYYTHFLFSSIVVL